MGNLDDIGYDPETVDDRDPFEVFPAGTEVICELVKSEVKPNSKKTGHRMSVEFVSLDEDAPNRHFFDGWNVKHESAQVQAIGQRSLARLMAACERPKATDTDELLGIPVCLVLGYQGEQDGFPAKNTVRDVKPASEKGVKKTAGGAVKKAAPSAAGGEAKKPDQGAPWAK